MKTLSKKSTPILALVALAAVLALSACGSNNNEATSSPVATETSAATPAETPAETPASASESAPAVGGETKEITISASNFLFDANEITAKVGDTIKLTLKNDSGNHGLAIEDLGVNIKNGETATIVLDKAGTFEFTCSIMCGSGHDNMTGKLIVE